MKKSIAISSLALILAIFTNCAQLNISLPTTTSNQNSGLSTAEVIRGLKEALELGAKKSGQSASKVDGFYKNQLLFIPFPPEAIKVKNTLEKAGMQKPVDDFVLSLNRAAEDAAQRAYPIFASAITGMTITDAMGILKGADNAATNYLMQKTTSQLKAEFKPIVKQSIEKVKVTSYWNPVVTNYNRLTVLTGGEQVNPDLENYITDKAIEGLFKLVENEEKLIRKDPAARVTDILKKVFGGQ
jgi:hypothetical protein